MPFDTNEPARDDEPLMALCALKARHPYMFSGRNIGHDVYRGWLPDFIVACDEIDQLLGGNKRGFHFRQIKEKYGSARYYWATGKLTPMRMSLVAGGGVLERQYGLESADDAEQKISRILLAAEEASRRKCILCSQPAEVQSFGGWLVCACARHGPDVIHRDDLLHAAHLREATRLKNEAEMYWSFRNKTEDVERALAQGNPRWARMAALELGIRFSHTTTALQLQAGNMGAEEQADARDQSPERVLSMFGQELERLLDFLKENQTARAAEVVPLLFRLLDVLDHRGGQ